MAWLFVEAEITDGTGTIRLMYRFQAWMGGCAFKHTSLQAKAVIIQTS